MEMGKNRLKGREFTEFLLRKSTRLSAIYTMSDLIFFSLLSFPIHLTSSCFISWAHPFPSISTTTTVVQAIIASYLPNSKDLLLPMWAPSCSFSTLQPEGSFQNTNLIIIHFFKNPSVAPNLYLGLWGYACVLVSNPEPLVLWASTYLPSFGI